MPMSDFEVRIGASADYPLVYGATAATLRGASWYADLDENAYQSAMRTVLARALASWTLLVAIVAAVPDEIAGFLLCRPGVAAVSLYVKRPYRRRGVARMLLDAGRLKDFVAVLGSPRAFKLAREKGYTVALSPYFGGILG
jgi:GNAT superfamily N-acetyltransferase